VDVVFDYMSKAERKVLIIALERRGYAYGAWTGYNYLFSSGVNTTVVRGELRAMCIEYAHDRNHEMAAACEKVRQKIAI
jgi:hypothetical protein